MDKKQNSFKTFSVPDPIRIKKVIKFIKRKFNRIENLDILECGIAKGGVADLLSDKGAKCYGIDIHPRSLDGVETFVKDINEGFPEFNNKFDIVFAGEVIEHIFDDREFLNNCFKNLKPGGYLIITTPNLNFIANRIIMLFGSLPKFFVEAPFHYHIYNKNKILKMMNETNFNVEKIISSHLLFSTRRNKIGIIFERLGNIFPSLGAHLIVFAKKPKN